MKNNTLLFVASACCAMTIFDTSLTGIALPLMIDDLNVKFAELQWFVSIYLIFFASFLLPAGLVGDRYGRRKTLIAGLAVFSVAAILFSMIDGIVGLVAIRALQGVGAAFMLAPALSIIGHSFHGDQETARVWAIWGSIMGLTMILAPIATSLVGDFGGWRWAFGMMGGVGLVLLLLVMRHISESRDPDARPLSWSATLSFCLAMMIWTGALIVGPDYGWLSQPLLLAYLSGTAVSALYLYLELSKKEPMLDLRLFRSLRFNGAVLAMVAYAATVQVMITFLPLYLQKSQGIPSFWLGVAMLPFSAAMFLFPHLSRHLARNKASFQILSLGLIIVALGNFGLSAAVVSGNILIFFLMMVVLGGGGGMINGETQKGILGTIPRNRAGMASGISTTARFSGVLIGFVVLSAIFSVMVKQTLRQSLCEGAASTCLAAEEISSEVIVGNFASMPASAIDLQLAAAQSYGAGFSWLFGAAGVFSLIAALFVKRAMR